MKATKILTLVALFAMAGGVAFAVDSTNVANEAKFNPNGKSNPQVNHIKVISAQLKVTDEIRRPVEQVYNLRSGQDANGTPWAEAWLINADGSIKQWFIKRPKFDTDGIVQKDAAGKVTTIEVNIENEPDFIKPLSERKQAIEDNDSLTAVQKRDQIDAIEEPRRRLSVGLWMPMVEPPPVVRDFNNKLDGTKAKIFLNSNEATKAKFPYVVKGVADGQFYVFRNVEYSWKFERVSDDENVAGKTDGNAPGSSKLAVWTPWFSEIETLKQAKRFIPLFGRDENAGSLPEPKVYANHHTKTYDSGIQGNTTVAESAILQMVLLTLKYEVATVTVSAPTGEGYPETSGTADPFNSGGVAVTVQGTVDLAAEPSNFQAKTLTKQIPEAYKVKTKENTDMWTLGEGTDYKLVYVEDYRGPAGVPADYTAGKQSAYNVVVGGNLSQDVNIVTEDDNAKANKASDEMKAKLKYYLGNGDVYKIENPFYNNSTKVNETNADPYLNFFYMSGNKSFGPITCGVQKDRWLEWYQGAPTDEQKQKSPYWQTQPESAGAEYVKTKLANSYAANRIPPWHMGVVFLTLGTDGTGQNGMEITEGLNGAWMAGSVATFTFFNSLVEMYKGMGTTNAAAQKALVSLLALQKVIENPQSLVEEEALDPAFQGVDQRKWYRFSIAGYDSNLGSFCVGPQPLEKNNPKVYQEAIIKKPAKDDPTRFAEVLIATWTIHKERIIMPSCYCSTSVDTAKSDLFTSKQVLEVQSADCCGVMTVSKPENTREGVNIEDKDSDTTLRTSPVPEMTLSNGDQEQQVIVPAFNELNYGEKLAVSNKDGSEKKVYGPGEYKEDFDMITKTFSKVDKNDNETPISFFEGNPKDMIVREDERIQIKTGGYDNIDGLTSFRGIGKTELKIEGAEGVMETLEYVDENGKPQTNTTITKEPASKEKSDLFKFNPSIELFHVFRNPGTYKVTYTLTEAVGNQSSKLVYNIKVVDVKQQNRSLEDRLNRQN